MGYLITIGNKYATWDFNGSTDRVGLARHPKSPDVPGTDNGNQIQLGYGLFEKFLNETGTAEILGKFPMERPADIQGALYSRLDRACREYAKRESKDPEFALYLEWFKFWAGFSLEHFQAPAIEFL